jgi:hypothetical protein
MENNVSYCWVLHIVATVISNFLFDLILFYLFMTRSYTLYFPSLFVKLKADILENNKEEIWYNV